jgi:3-(3-hydroxy-phenyl)propionate hydroxylase
MKFALPVGVEATAVYRDRDVVDAACDAHGVDVVTTQGEPLRAGWLVGCDGGRTSIRRWAGRASTWACTTR